MFLFAIACGLFILLPPSAQSETLGLEITEQQSLHTSFVFDSAEFKFRKERFHDGNLILETSKYSIREGMISKDGKTIQESSNSAEVLYQCEIGDFDILILRVEKNSISSPKKLFSAMIGHPIQRSTVVAMKIVDENIIDRQELIGRDSSYRWKASLYRIQDPQMSQ